MADLDEILAEIIEAKAAARILVVKLYGENGFEGDITEIKRSLKDNAKLANANRVIIAAIIGSSVLGGGIIGLLKLL